MKIITELLPAITIQVPVKHLRTNPLLHVPIVRTNYRQNTFIWRASKNFNFDLGIFNHSCAMIRYLSNSFLS